MNVKFPNNTSKWQMEFNSEFKGLKYSVLTVEKNIYKTQHLEGSGTPALYIGRTVLKGQFPVTEMKL
jgi:protein-disulfide isomerase